MGVSWTGRATGRKTLYADGFSQTEMCFSLALVNGSLLQPPKRSRSLIASKLRHQVELGGPDVPERNGEAVELAIFHVKVMRDQALAHDVVLVDPEVVLFSLEDMEGRVPTCKT